MRKHSARRDLLAKQVLYQLSYRPREPTVSAIERYLEEVLQDEVDRAIVDGYKRIPQEPDALIEAAARDSIAAEPW